MFNLLYWTKKKTNLIELKSMFQTHQKEVKLVKIFPTGDPLLCGRIRRDLAVILSVYNP